MGKYLNFGPLQKLPHWCPKWANTKVTWQLSKMRVRGVKATFGQCPKEKGLFLCLPLLSRICLVTVFLTSFNGLSVPISGSPMSKLFRLSESLGKSNVKKWSQIWKLLLIKCVKSPRQKKFFLHFFSFVHSF